MVDAPLYRSLLWRASGAGLLFCLMGASAAVAAGHDLPRRKYSPFERMAPARLKATHIDVERIQRSRETLPPFPGPNDYRAILHAHAEDSAHT
jgi:hypothetical protein